MTSSFDNSTGKSGIGVHSGKYADPAPYVAWSLDVEPWMDEAECGPHTAELFFDERQNASGRMARESAAVLCNACPVRTECRERQLRIDAANPSLIWGFAAGLTAEQRRALIRAQKAKEPIVVRVGPKLPGVTRDVCGTGKGQHQHRKHWELMCDACKAYQATQRVKWKSRAKAKAS